MRRGFTMIELIFVIVILGILAAVAIPKMMATRTDAKVSKISQEVQSAVQEIPSYVISQGVVPNAQNLTEMSQVLKSLEQNGGGEEVNQSRFVIFSKDKTGCVILDTNTTGLMVELNSSNNDAICTGVKNFVKETNYTVVGHSVTY